MSREEFIHKNAHLFWYTPADALNDLSDDVVVEFIFNYGDWDSLKELCSIIGFQKLKQVYENIQGRKKGNYFPEAYNYLKVLVERYAP